MAIDLRGRSSVSFYDTFSAFPSTGSTTTLYVDRGDMVVYIWNGSSYEQLNNGSNITTVANYSELLAIGASNVPNMFYWCSSAQGTSWLPGPLGGTYYNSGLYYSNGTTWEYMNSPYQATQIEVDAGIVADKFVTPSTLYNAGQWGTKENNLPSIVGNSLKVLRVNASETAKEWATIPSGITIGTTPITSGVDGSLLIQRIGKVENSIIYENNLGDVIIPTVSVGAIRGLVIGGTTRNALMALTLYNSLSIKKGGSIWLERSDNTNIQAISYSSTNFNLTIGSPASASGFIYFNKQNGNNIATFDVNLGHFGIGTTTPAARLDVKASGALSTDIALRVRNSADTSNLFMVKGNGVLNAANLPTSATGLVAGDIWNNLGILTIV